MRQKLEYYRFDEVIAETGDGDISAKIIFIIAVNLFNIFFIHITETEALINAFF